MSGMRGLNPLSTSFVWCVLILLLFQSQPTQSFFPFNHHGEHELSELLYRSHEKRIECRDEKGILNIKQPCVTVIIVGNHVPVHPRTRLIVRTINSVFTFAERSARLRHIPIILTHAACRQQSCPKYAEYFTALKSQISENNATNMLILLAKSPGLTGSIRAAFEYVKTQFVFVLQHDLAFTRSFNLDKVLADMIAQPTILQHVKFNWMANKELPRRSKCDAENFGEQFIGESGMHYTKTICWSDNNHLALKSYYDEVVFPTVPDDEFMEKVLRNLSRLNQTKYGNWLYGNKWSKAMVRHLDGHRART